jgi:hypothetical protein
VFASEESTHPRRSLRRATVRHMSTAVAHVSPRSGRRVMGERHGYRSRQSRYAQTANVPLLRPVAMDY